MKPRSNEQGTLFKHEVKLLKLQSKEFPLGGSAACALLKILLQNNYIRTYYHQLLHHLPMLSLQITTGKIQMSKYVYWVPQRLVC